MEQTDRSQKGGRRGTGCKKVKGFIKGHICQTHGHCVIMARGMGRDGRLGKAGKAGKIGTAVIASIIRRKKKSKQASKLWDQTSNSASWFCELGQTWTNYCSLALSVLEIPHQQLIHFMSLTICWTLL